MRLQERVAASNRSTPLPSFTSSVSLFNNALLYQKLRMGSAASKPARHFPKSVKPKWAGTRTPNPSEATTSQSAMPQASETRNEGSTLQLKASYGSNQLEAIERDSVDPQFLANLSKLGQVRVDHHMQTIRPVSKYNMYVDTRMSSEHSSGRRSLTTHHSEQNGI